jgi:hypothetical protein
MADDKDYGHENNQICSFEVAFKLSMKVISNICTKQIVKRKGG